MSFKKIKKIIDEDLKFDELQRGKAEEAYELLINKLSDPNEKLYTYTGNLGNFRGSGFSILLSRTYDEMIQVNIIFGTGYSKISGLLDTSNNELSVYFKTSSLSYETLWENPDEFYNADMQNMRRLVLLDKDRVRSTFVHEYIHLLDSKRIDWKSALGVDTLRKVLSRLVRLLKSKQGYSDHDIAFKADDLAYLTVVDGEGNEVGNKKFILSPPELLEVTLKDLIPNITDKKGYSRDKYSSKDSSKYWSNPVETNAYIQQAVADFKRDFKKQSVLLRNSILREWSQHSKKTDLSNDYYMFLSGIGMRLPSIYTKQVGSFEGSLSKKISKVKRRLMSRLAPLYEQLREQNDIDYKNIDFIVSKEADSLFNDTPKSLLRMYMKDVNDTYTLSKNVSVEFPEIFHYSQYVRDDVVSHRNYLTTVNDIYSMYIDNYNKER